MLHWRYSLFILVLFLWHVDLCFGLLLNSLLSFETLWILFLELGLASSHGFSFLIWVINIMKHWATFFSLISRLWASDGLDHNSLDVDSLPTSPLVTQSPTLDTLYNEM